MAGLVTKLFRLINPFDEHTIASSRAARGGVFDQGRFHRTSPDALQFQAGLPNLLPLDKRNQETPPQPVNPFQDLPEDDGTSGSGSALLDAFLQLFEGQYYTDPTEYYNATLGAIDRTADEQRGRARDEAGRSRTSLLDQVAQLFEQLDTEERKGKGNIASYYGGLGDLYQSSQGVREQEFAGDIAKERGRVTKERDTSNADIDRWLNDQMTSIDQTRQGAIGQQFGSAMDIRDKFAEKYQPNLVNTRPGDVNVTDTSALLKNLNAFLTPSNVSQRYRGQSGSKGDVYSYLNPLG